VEWSAILQREQSEVEEAQTGSEAIALIRARHYDAVVLDIMMGAGSGHEVLQVLREQRADVKCVVVISAISAVALEAISAENVQVKLRKPFELDALVTAVHRCIAD
jgi:CheY-like chemotaxis protein